MKVLVTGMTSRQTNELKNKNDVMFSWLIAHALRSAGHEVELRRPEVEEDLEDFDHVFVGLSPLHGLGSSSSYGAVSAILRGWGNPDKLTLYLDDPDVLKVTGGIRTMRTNPERFTKPFFAYRREYELANSPEWKSWLRQGVIKLDEEEWPRLLVPMHSWGDAEAAYGRRVPQAAGRIVGVDPTSFMPTFPTNADGDRLPQWIFEAGPDDRWRRTVQTRFDVVRYGKNSVHGRRPNDERLLELYGSSWGVMASPPDPEGWWTSRMGYAIAAGAVWVTKWQHMRHLGEDFTWLPYQVEELSSEERDELAARQKVIFGAVTHGRDKVVETLESIVGAKVDA